MLWGCEVLALRTEAIRLHQRQEELQQKATGTRPFVYQKTFVRLGSSGDSSDFLFLQFFLLACWPQYHPPSANCVLYRCCQHAMSGNCFRSDLSSLKQALHEEVSGEWRDYQKFSPVDGQKCRCNCVTAFCFHTHGQSDRLAKGNWRLCGHCSQCRCFFVLEAFEGCSQSPLQIVLHRCHLPTSLSTKISMFSHVLFFDLPTCLFSERPLIS